MPRYNWRTMTDIVRAPRQPRPVAIEGICKVGDLILITGGFDTFKSTLGLELAFTLASGHPFLQHFPLRCGRLRGAVIQCEIDPGDYETHRIADRFPVCHNLEFLSDVAFTFDELPHLKAEFDEMAFDFVLFDPVGPMWPTYAVNSREPFDENRKTHVSPFLKRLRLLGKMVILVHHDTKQQTRASGSASLLNDPDVRVFIDRETLDGNGHGPVEQVNVNIRNRLQKPTLPFTARMQPTGRLTIPNDPTVV